jgi:hypothetical protein
MLEEGAWILLFGKKYIIPYAKNIIVIFVIGGRD